MNAPWDRLLWGVEFIGSLNESPQLIGGSWYENREDKYPGEAYRCLLFKTRRHAKAWCDERMKEWRERPSSDPVSRWKLRPVRVRATVQRVGRPS